MSVGADIRPPGLRVAMFVDQFPSVSTTFILAQMLGLIRLGVDLTIYTRHHSSGPTVHAMASEIESAATIRVLPTIPSGRRWRLLSIVRRWREGAYRGRTRSVLRLLLQPAAGTLAQRLELALWASAIDPDEPIDVVHCQFATLGAKVSELRCAGLITGRLVVSMRGFDVTRYPSQHPGCYRRLFREADLFLPVCLALMDDAIRLGCPPERTRVLHSGIDLERFRPLPAEAPDRRPVRLLSVARLVEKKGLEYAIRGVARLVEEGNSLHYRIVGDGPLRGSLETLVTSLRLEGVVELAGSVDQDAIVLELQQCDIFMATSTTARDQDREGIPNALKEAMAVGRPVVATVHSGIPELVAHGESGMLVPEGDAEAIATALRELLGNPDRWTAMGAAARSAVVAGFDQAQLNRCLLQYYMGNPGR
jgi:colanic acid/amylovoran biosynthesis glycosyltransferase